MTYDLITFVVNDESFKVTPAKTESQLRRQ
jgi:hypothetical protein